MLMIPPASAWPPCSERIIMAKQRKTAKQSGRDARSGRGAKGKGKGKARPAKQRGDPPGEGLGPDAWAIFFSDFGSPERREGMGARDVLVALDFFRDAVWWQALYRFQDDSLAAVVPQWHAVAGEALGMAADRYGMSEAVPDILNCGAIYRRLLGRAAGSLPHDPRHAAGGLGGGWQAFLRLVRALPADGRAVVRQGIEAMQRLEIKLKRVAARPADGGTGEKREGGEEPQNLGPAKSGSYVSIADKARSAGLTAKEKARLKQRAYRRRDAAKGSDDVCMMATEPEQHGSTFLFAESWLDEQIRQMRVGASQG